MFCSAMHLAKAIPLILLFFPIFGIKPSQHSNLPILLINTILIVVFFNHLQANKFEQFLKDVHVSCFYYIYSQPTRSQTSLVPSPHGPKLRRSHAFFSPNATSPINMVKSVPGQLGPKSTSHQQIIDWPIMGKAKPITHDIQL